MKKIYAFAQGVALLALTTGFAGQALANTAGVIPEPESLTAIMT